MELTIQHQNFIKSHALSESPKECCGIIDLNNNIIKYQNISEFPERSFIMECDDISHISAFYHSHNSGDDFSLADMAFSEKLKIPCILYCIYTDKFYQYSPNGYNIPYEGRPFMMGCMDCFTLTQDFFKRELNININNIDGFTNHPGLKEHKNWKNSNYHNYSHNTLIRDFLLLQNFIEVQTLKKYDIILLQTPGVKFPSHMAVYLGENTILHHFYEFSAKENYRNAYQKMTKHILRHQSLL